MAQKLNQFQTGYQEALADLAAAFKRGGLDALADWGVDNSLTDDNRKQWKIVRMQLEGKH